MKRERATSKGWKTQANKLEVDLVNLNSIAVEKKSNKKLIEEKDKLIQSLRRKIKGFPSDHPQTEDIVIIQAEKEELKKEVFDLKAKLL